MQHHYPDTHPFSPNYKSMTIDPSMLMSTKPKVSHKKKVLTQPPKNARANIAPPTDHAKKFRQRKASI